MVKGGCVDGLLDPSTFSTPIPLIGLYITAATTVCFFLMACDFLHGYFHKKPFFPCKWFRINALTLTLLQVVTKIPADLTASMPRVEDQLSKLTGTTLLCISLGFYMPSLGTMETSERYSNMMALSLMVITVIVNVYIQMQTGPIFAFTPEHIIIIVFMFVLLLLMWSSALALKGQIEYSESHYRSQTLKGGQIEYSESHYRSQTCEGTSNVNKVKELEKLLKKVYVLNYTGNPQTLLCETLHHHAYGLLSALSAIVVIEATLRTFIFKSTVRYCSGEDDFKWSILFVIVIQLATIAMGTCTIICRWYSFVRHTDSRVLSAHKHYHFLEREFEYMKFKIFSLRVSGKWIFRLFQFEITELFIIAQMMFYGFCNCFIAYPIAYLIYHVKMLFGVIMPFFGKWNYNGSDQYLETKDYVISSVGTHDIFNLWINRMAVKDWNRWKGKYEGRYSGIPENCIPLISNSECDGFDVRELEAIGIDFSKKFEFNFKYDQYKVSSLSVLVLSRMLAKLMQSSRENFQEKSSKALQQSFEIIYYVDQKILGDQTRLELTKNVWANWNNTEHWFGKTISDACTHRTNSEKSDSELDHALKVLKHACHVMEGYYSVNGLGQDNDITLARRHKLLILMELSILCKFILSKKHESIEALFGFLEMGFVKMLHFTLSSLPLAILKEIEGDYPNEICEGNVRVALKFFCALKSLSLDKEIQWSWPRESLSSLDAPDPGSDYEAEDLSFGVDRQVAKSTYASLAACLCCNSDERV